MSARLGLKFCSTYFGTSCTRSLGPVHVVAKLGTIYIKNLGRIYSRITWPQIRLGILKLTLVKLRVSYPRLCSLYSSSRSLPRRCKLLLASLLIIAPLDYACIVCYLRSTKRSRIRARWPQNARLNDFSM